MNPYWNQDFFGFFVVLFSRLIGKISHEDLFTDEIQMLVLSGVAISTVTLGNFLTMRKMTMLANSLSHTTLLGIVLSYILLLHFHTHLGMCLHLTPSIFLLAALFSAVLTTFCTEFARNRLKLQEDASIGLVFTTLFALGIILVTLFTRNSHIGVEVITGNSDALHVADIKMVWGVTAITLLFTALFFRHWILITFDENLALFLGVPVKGLHYLMMFLTALTLISAFRAAGILLVLSFIVGPPLIARLWSHKLFCVISLSLGFGVLFSILGVAVSRFCLSVYGLSFSTGAIVVTLIAMGYAISVLLTFRSSKGLLLNNKGATSA